MVSDTCGSFRNTAGAFNYWLRKTKEIQKKQCVTLLKGNARRRVEVTEGMRRKIWLCVSLSYSA